MHGALGDDEQAAQLGEPGDDVVGEVAAGVAQRAAGAGPLDERHHGDGGATSRAGGDHALGARGRSRGCNDRFGRARLRRRGAATFCSGGLPRRAQGPGVEPLRLEQLHRRRQVLLALANASATAERAEHGLVHALVEGRELQPFLQIFERLVGGDDLGQMLQQGRVAAAETASLGDQPAVELGAALDLQAVEEVAGEQGKQLAQPLGLEGVQALLRGTGDLDHVDGATVEIEGDGVAARLHAALVRLVEDAARLAQTPAKLAARIVGHVPEQLAQLGCA